ncbi:Phenol hydroxylase P1 protein [Collimonas sp. OK607]|uniref:aromatic/alkene monooxygenase hydroxylase subunit beta n=1 Tax=Collimonas sp. OK607 TaxID=1798194 RepID=UPI0008E1EAFF|nr:aromatic/alkene monooxygenase hydroxylase subunit beta [Collimonas sp. OK607]SFB34999.1 Phenol hydroxylase P1 protein [Collimonas sp. OK607]
MHLDLRTVSITPLRQTFDSIAARIGGDKSASRYQEATLDVQSDTNFHYRPLWDQEHDIYDASRTALKMNDWYAFKDPRQFYYGTYTLARARMQETAEGDFDFVETRGLAASYPAAAKDLALEVLLPLRHVEWGANMNNTSMCAYGYGAAITQPCLFNAMDHLGMAQYLTRAGLLLDDVAALDAAKQAWLVEEQWQELRHYVEDTFVLKDWFELFIAQNLVLNGLLYPLIYQHFDSALSAQAGPVVSMLTRFQSEWYAETSKWVNATLKIASGESSENQQLLSGWTKTYRDRAITALAPIAALALGEKADTVMTELVDEFNTRAIKFGLTL